MLYEYFIGITQQVKCNNYTRDQIKFATISLFNSSEKYVDSLLFSKDLEPDQKVIKDLYSTLIQKHNSYITYTKTINTTQALINAFSVKAVRFDQQCSKNKRKDNSAYYLQYSAFESRVMKRIIDQIDEEIGEISLYTVYNAVYVERYHVKQVEQIMMENLIEEYCK